jgi:hypothetical protein
MDDSYAEIPEGLIASGQSFWVRTTGVNPKLTIREGVKVAGGATFFRREQIPISSFVISLTKDSLTDVAYYKVRPTAKRTLDDWDGLKLDNELFDIAIAGDDNKAFAIYATNQMPCDSIIQVSLKDLTPGTYSINLITRHNFSRYSYTLIDKYSVTETSLYPEHPLKLVVNNDPRSSAVDRLSIRLAEQPPASNVSVSNVQSACVDNVVKLDVYDAERGVTYSVWSDDRELVAAEASGDTLQIQVSASSIGVGEHILKLKAQSACHAVLLDETVNLTIEPTIHLLADTVTGCSGDALILTATSNNPAAVISWFAEAHSEDTLASGKFLQTSPLYKSTVYFVEASTRTGCKSSRIPVLASVKIYPPAEITVVGDSILQSNYRSGNSWYYNGERIALDTSAYFRFHQSGTYTLKVDTMGCLLKANYDYRVLQSEASHNIARYYPNPTSDFLYVANEDHNVERIEIFDARGLIVQRLNTRSPACSKEIEIDVGGLSAGVYTIVITDISKSEVFKFIKRS